MACAAGTYSQTGVEPCLPCPKGYYQPGVKQTSCLLCGGSKSTYGAGASSFSQCIGKYKRLIKRCKVRGEMQFSLLIQQQDIAFNVRSMEELRAGFGYLPVRTRRNVHFCNNLQYVRAVYMETLMAPFFDSPYQTYPKS